MLQTIFGSLLYLWRGMAISRLPFRSQTELFFEFRNKKEKGSTLRVLWQQDVATPENAQTEIYATETEG